MNLNLIRESGGLRHYLAGRPVHAGSILEVRGLYGPWKGARYEWTFRESERPYLVMPEGTRDITPADELRWPET